MTTEATDTTQADLDTFEGFADVHLLPDAIFYGKRLISLEKVWELSRERALILGAALSYQSVLEQYVAEGAAPTGGTPADPVFTDWDAGYASGLKHALDLIRNATDLPLDPAPELLPVTLHRNKTT